MQFNAGSLRYKQLETLLRLQCYDSSCSALGVSSRQRCGTASSTRMGTSIPLPGHRRTAARGMLGQPETGMGPPNPGTPSPIVHFSRTPEGIGEHLIQYKGTPHPEQPHRQSILFILGLPEAFLCGLLMRIFQREI